ncbi:hypothetical protein BDB01DRAFT_795142 [Pilobolus umbonatus]|nr:hypothetical protein BDB01DRAFT_795142 [Pilobolus umbonatus]
MSFNTVLVQIRSFGSVRSLHPKKFTSILQDVPVRPISPWQIFLREKIQEEKAANIKIVIPEVSRKYGAEWRSISDDQKKAYSDAYAKEFKAFQESYNAALENATPKQFHEENLLRKKYKLSPLKDPRQPKKPLNRYILYTQHLRSINDPLFKIPDSSTRMREIAKKYKSLTPDEVKVFTDQAEVHRQKYHELMEVYKRELA